MRIWHDWTSEEKELFTEFHRDFDASDCPDEQLSYLKAVIDIELFCRPLELKEIVEVKNILFAVKHGFYFLRKSVLVQK
jgi:hypothetical protein